MSVQVRSVQFLSAPPKPASQEGVIGFKAAWHARDIQSAAVSHSYSNMTPMYATFRILRGSNYFLPRGVTRKFAPALTRSAL
eukprot:6293745-Pyramimonas_sp.AAC.1